MPRKVTATAPRPKEPTASRRTSSKHEIAANAIDYDLENSIPYLLTRAGARMSQAFTKELKQFNLSLTDWRVLVALHYKAHQRLSELALHTSTETSTLSRVMDGLIARGLVLRDRSGEDARALALSLTPEGFAMTERVIPLAQLYERVALAGFSAAQCEALREMLRKIYDSMSVLDRPE